MIMERVWRGPGWKWGSEAGNGQKSETLRDLDTTGMEDLAGFFRYRPSPGCHPPDGYVILPGMLCHKMLFLRYILLDRGWYTTDLIKLPLVYFPTPTLATLMQQVPFGLYLRNSLLFAISCSPSPCPGW